MFVVLDCVLQSVESRASMSSRFDLLVASRMFRLALRSCLGCARRCNPSLHDSHDHSFCCGSAEFKMCCPCWANLVIAANLCD